MQSVQKDQIYGKLKFPDIELNDNIKGILLDIDNTLYAYDVCHRFALDITIKFICKKYNYDYGYIKNQYSNARSKVGVDLSGLSSSHSRLLYFQKLVESLFSQSDIKLILNLERLYWESFLSKMEIVPNAEIFINRCNSLKIPICIITDLTAEIQMKKLIQLDIDSKINFIVSSEEAGVEKPHPFIFKLALEKLNLSNSEVLMIGDSISKDIKGAERLDIQSIYVGEK